MSRKYQNPPLVEALCEFQFLSENWDLTIPGLVYQKIKSRFPTKRPLNKMEIEVKQQVSEISQRFRGDTGRIQFFNKEENGLVQVGPNLLAVNHLSPYPHWTNFRPLIFEMFSIYREIANPSGIKRVGLRFINRIEIPQSQFNLIHYFKLHPKLPKEIPHDFSSIFMRVEIPYLSDGAKLGLTFGSAPKKDTDETAFVLDLDFATLPDYNLSFEDCENWVETAHTHVETAFEACITDHLRELFVEIM